MDQNEVVSLPRAIVAGEARAARLVSICSPSEGWEMLRLNEYDIEYDEARAEKCGGRREAERARIKQPPSRARAE